MRNVKTLKIGSICEKRAKENIQVGYAKCQNCIFNKKTSIAGGVVECRVIDIKID